MTDNEKLQKLFQAALNDSSEGKVPLARAFPTAAPVRTVEALPESVSEPISEPIRETAATATAEIALPPQHAANAGLGEAASAELGILLDEQLKRKNRKRRRETIGTLIVFFTLTVGGVGWFVQSPGRMQALKEAIRDIHDAGDLKTMVAKYQKALDRIAVRSQQIDAATESMGGSSNQDNEKDPNFNAEMKEMMGGKGKTTGERNAGLQKAFGKKFKQPEAAETPAAEKPVAKTADEEAHSLEWK